MSERALRPGGMNPVMSALKRFELRRDLVTGKWHPTLPKDFQSVHAVEDASYIPRSKDRSQDPYFLEGPNEYSFALCGAKIKVVLAVEFRPVDTQACERCVMELAAINERYATMTKNAEQKRKLAQNYKPVKL
ncbi:hypothetical protein [Glutamicibacter mishrai]|nr:hypothetical protein [Glutamicibacter mishrai]